MKRYLLPQNTKFYKANLHAHSTVSDGALSPEELKNAYKQHGYSILAITDHFKLEDHSDLNDDDFLMITGCELAIVEPGDFEFKFKKCSHLNLYSRDPHRTNLFDFTTEYTADSINEIISSANKNGFLVCCNHPTWSMEELSQLLQYNGLFAMEIYNTLSVSYGIDEYNIHEYDAMVRAGKKIFCIAADDCHGNLPETHPYCDMFGGFVNIAAKELTYNAIFTALQNGDFYASYGPEIFELYIEDGIARIKCSPVREVKAVTGTRRSARAAISKNSDDFITEAEFAVCPDNKYIRFEITDKNGNKACTRAYTL